MDSTVKKRRGVHYTPPALAKFLASQTAALIPASLSKCPSPFRVLDPACGDGGLLEAMLAAVPDFLRSEVHWVGFDRDQAAVDSAKARLSEANVECRIECKDFLLEPLVPQYDLVIANPPYVRTQVMGAERSQELAETFGLTGRVDLYQAFAMAISRVLHPGGAMGLLTSNRFLTVRAGKKMRELLSADFQLAKVFDLGDTKLFGAAVLPVVATGTRLEEEEVSEPKRADFVRVYSTGDLECEWETDQLLEAVSDPAVTGNVSTPDGMFEIERGNLLVDDDCRQPWSLSSPDSEKWLATVRAQTRCLIGDVAEVRVGIKTTADKVFVRENWSDVEVRPETRLLRPLLTHHDARRWSSPTKTRKRVLYPYQPRKKNRTPIELSKFPAASEYLESHREQLEGRKYVLDAGREWFEIWVPHRPQDWAGTKIVWPDISEQPKFFLDDSGSIVNGDCYWMRLKPDVDPDWIYLILAVANSTVATRFYDTMFHNKLYAGRRRFMTQYVSKFPLPCLTNKVCQNIVRQVKRLINSNCDQVKQEKAMARLVAKSFGLPS